VKTVEVVEAHVGDEQVRLDAVEGSSRSVKRRCRHYRVSGVVQERLGPVQNIRVGVDEDNE